MAHPISYRPPAPGTPGYRIFDTRRKNGTLFPIGHATKSKFGFDYIPVDSEDRSSVRTFRTMKVLKNTLEREGQEAVVEEIRREATADQIDGYDQDDLGESPDF